MNIALVVVWDVKDWHDTWYALLIFASSKQ